MSSNAERAAVLTEALLAAVAGDAGRLTNLYTDDVKAWTPALAASSATELLAEIARRDDAFSDVDVEVTPLDVGGDHACAEWRVTMTHSGPLAVRDGAALEATGIEVTLYGVTVVEFRDDRICSLRQYWDELAVYEQLGLVGASETG